MTDFSSVLDFGIRFGDHPDYPDASRQLNVLYATSVDSPTAFFVDPSSCTTVRSDNNLVTLLRDIIVNEVITPLALGTTTNLNAIRVAINSSPLCVCMTSITHLNVRRLNTKNMEFYLRNALTAKVPSITFVIDVSHLDFDFASGGPMNYLDWDRISPTAFQSSLRQGPPPSASAAGITAVDLQAAVANLSTGIAAAVTSGINTHATALTAQFVAATGSSRPPAASSTSASPSLRLFNHNALPSDVKARYLARIDDAPILGSVIALSRGYR